MLCYKCGTPLSDSDYCANCGAQVAVYKKIIRMSNTYYNMALLRAGNRDLSGAADVLRRSLRLNKRNTKARNLLGLVYFEMGETVSALSQWIISQHIRPKKNPANEYLNTLRSNQNKLDALNQSIRKFNVALSYARQENEDMAVIQLKQVVSQNPKFIKGYQLLALLLMKNDHYDQARKYVRKALVIDQCNPILLRYQKEINSRFNKVTDNSKKAVDKIPEQLSGHDVIIPPHAFKEPANGATTIINILIGLIIGALAVYFIVTPIKVNHQLNKNNSVQLENNQKLAVKNSSLDELQRQVNTLTEDKDKLQKEVDKYKGGSSSTIKNYEYLIDALNQYAQQNYTDSAASYASIDSSVTIDSTAYNNAYKYLSSKLKGQVTDSLYQLGEQAYNSGDYDTAIKNYKKCLKQDKSYVQALYKLAYSYYKKGDTTNSNKYFKQIVKDFPDSQYYNEAVGIVGTAD